MHKDAPFDFSLYMRQKEAAQVLDLSKQRVNQLCKEKKLEALNIGGISYPTRASVEEYREKRLAKLLKEQENNKLVGLY